MNKMNNRNKKPHLYDTRDFPRGPWLALPLCLLLLLSHAPAQAADTESNEEGRILAQKVHARPKGDDASSRVVMLVQSEGNSPKQRLLYSYARHKDDSDLTLLRFIEPSEIEGTGLLTVEEEGEEADQWLYLPALDRVRRISSSRKGGRFVGSDFYYEDLTDRSVDMDHHRLLGKAKLGGILCDVLESRPVDPDNSVYTRRISWIHPKLLLPLRVDLYSNEDKGPEKRLQARKIKKIQGYWTIFESTMYNLEDESKTQLLITDIQYNQGLPDELFTRRGLADGSREQTFVPGRSEQ